MNAESAGQGPEITQIPFVRLSQPDSATDQRQNDKYSTEYSQQNDHYPFSRDKYSFSKDHKLHSGGRNKRKNFNPRYTSTSPCDDNDDSANPSISRDNLQLMDGHQNDQHVVKSPLELSSASTGNAAGSGCAGSEAAEFAPWLQMFNRYDQLVKSSELVEHHRSGATERGLQRVIPDSEVFEWDSKFRNNKPTASTIRELFKAYQRSDKTEAMDDINAVNISTETEPPTPPTTPHICNSSIRSSIQNGCTPSHNETGFQSPTLPISSIKHENLNPSPPPPQVTAAEIDTTNSMNNSSANTSLPDMAKHHVTQTDHQWPTDSVPDENDSQKCKKNEFSDDEDTDYSSKPVQAHSEGVDNSHDNSSDCEPQHGDASAAGGEIHQWSAENFQSWSTKKGIKSECDEMDSIFGGAENNLIDEDAYPGSPNDFADLANDNDADDDDSYSVNMFCDDEEDDKLGASSVHDRNNLESTDAYGSPSVIPERESSCSNSSSRISVRNLGGYFDRSQSHPIAGVRNRTTETNSNAANSVQSYFTSYSECQNEMCRLENQRDHYHCFDCDGKIFSKKEEMIRHVKWHRKRIESRNLGFLRFTSSDDCSTEFEGHCQHNRKQTHYHCIQSNCDRVYISTSDVQMHSNFHRKDSAIYNEGFQRFRANEQCNADYCMFAGQKTTHFHCRRFNCRYTFKNKADMEKHKTYHIKDLKLTRDGFKKFFKNEPCPYKRCRFSMVNNHIHCARENCSYVLHSSGQLLSHKRKHDRMDNEQTYCRYKMLSVKAALLGSAAAAAAAANPTISPYNMTNTLLQLRDLEINSLIPKASSDHSLSPKQEHFTEPTATTTAAEAVSANSSSVSIEFLQQLKKNHDQLIRQKQSQPLEQAAVDMSYNPEVSVFPVIPVSGSPQHQYNMGLEYSQITPSVVQQFFTTECPSQHAGDTGDTDKANSTSTQDDVIQKPLCSWKERLEPHLHCIVKDCEAVIPNNVLDMSAHIRLHGYNRDVYAATAAASETLLSGTSTNPMQITTIDGFFNRKRGRPPKNRFIEVYKNAQQSPQAIFTSFKLEKQTSNSSTLCDTTPNTIGCNDALAQQNLVQTPIASQITPHMAKGYCEGTDGQFSMAQNQPYQCKRSDELPAGIADRDILGLHFERQHTIPSFADVINKKFKRFDRVIGLDCGISDCRLRKSRPHLHCRQCFRQISPFDLETHVCSTIDRKPSALQTAKITPPLKSLDSRNADNQQSQLEQPAENLIRDYARLQSATFSPLTELQKKVLEMEPETSALAKRNHEDEKVLVVRAAGTYFPENTSELSGTYPQVHQKPTLSLSVGECQNSMPSSSLYCSLPNCKLKRRPHEHCPLCDQTFFDIAKSKAHRLKHISHLASEPCDDTKPINYLKLFASNESQPSQSEDRTFEDQPQDLSISPNATATATIPTYEDKAQASGDTYTSPPPDQPQQPNPTTGQFPNLFPQDFINNLSMQNFHLTQLATWYQQNYYQQLYPPLSIAAALSRQQHHRQAETYRVPCNDDKPYFTPSPTNCSKSSSLPPGLSPLSKIPTPHPLAGTFPFINPLLLKRSAESVAANETPAVHLNIPIPMTSDGPNTLKRKLSKGAEDFSVVIDALSPSTKKQMQYISRPGPCGTHEQHGQHFKLKDEQIPTGYLKFRFNEDCYFPKCGYRNHQSHFHCDRNDCHYSFCDKTRFVQHTARHERLDKLMGNDFRQYRANMNCGYENCSYFKNLGSANKSSHFHCLKCDFICSDTNKVVAHRRQHTKMEYIRMAGFRKVTNSEKCNSTFEATVPMSGNEMSGTIECSYSQKQTHYHCLVCDVSVLSRAQLASHKHRI